MSAAPQHSWIYSSKRNPCPICGRTKDGDCRINSNGQQVICHHPKDLEPGDVVNGWAFTGNTGDGRAGHFKPHEPLESDRRSRIVPLQTRNQQQLSPGSAVPAPITGPVELAQLPTPRDEPPDHLPHDTKLEYSSSQWVKVVVDASGKRHIPHHTAADGKQIGKAGPDPWPLWHEAEAIEHGRGRWIAEAEGEKCARWLQSGGLVAVTQPGHDHTRASIEARYRRLVEAKVSGIVYLADNDETGGTKADRCASAAAAAGLSFIAVYAADVWPEIPSGGSIDDAPGSAADRVAALQDAIPAALERHQQQTAVEVVSSPMANIRRHRLAPDEAMELLPSALGGAPRLNTRSGEIELVDQVLSGNALAELYLQLSNTAVTWPKETTIDAVMAIARRNSFDPVAEYLEQVAADVEPLPLEQWHRLDQHLLGVDDTIAAEFLPQFFISAVARTFRQGCGVRRSPVLIGPQWRGKTALGRILFGADHWIEGVKDLSRDALQRCHSAWGVELAELNGITKRADQEALKAFLTETTDSYRQPYDRAPERKPRRFVFWGTSNGPPLRDLSGSTRFVCIPLPDQMLPLGWATNHRDAIWARAVAEFRMAPPGKEPWDHASENQRQAIADRNADHQEIDPWADRVRAFLEKRRTCGTVPVTIPEVLDHLTISADRQNGAMSSRVRALAEALGWRLERKRRSGEKNKSQGLWPAELPGSDHASGHPGHPSVTPRGAQHQPSQGNGSGHTGHPGHPISTTLGREVKDKGQEDGAVHPNERVEGLRPSGVTGVTSAPNQLQHSRSEETGGVTSRVTGVTSCQSGPPRPVRAPAPEIEPNSARSNLATFRPGDRIHVAHPRLPIGRLHAAVVTGTLNASVKFNPPLEGLLADTGDPDAGEWAPPVPIASASSARCLPQLGTLEKTGTAARPSTATEPSWEPLDQDGLNAFLAELAEQGAFIAQGLQSYRFQEAAA